MGDRHSRPTFRRRRAPRPLGYGAHKTLPFMIQVRKTATSCAVAKQDSPNETLSQTNAQLTNKALLDKVPPDPLGNIVAICHCSRPHE